MGCKAATRARVHDADAIRQIPRHFSFVHVRPSKNELASAPALPMHHAALISAAVPAADVAAQPVRPASPPAASDAAAGRQQQLAEAVHAVVAPLPAAVVTICY